VGDLLQMALPVLMAGLQDRDDSVQAAAAEALVPLAPMLLQMQIEEVRGGVALVRCLLDTHGVGRMGLRTVHVTERCASGCAGAMALAHVCPHCTP
jgi:hypothetical protein